MKAMKRLMMAALALAGAAGCAATPGGAPSAAAPAAGPATLADGLALGPLPQAAIPAESCGLLLWTVSSQRPIPVFRFLSGKSAEIQLGGRIVSLTLVDAAGESAYGVFEQQVFQGPDGLAVEVTGAFGVGFNGGVYLEDGVIRLRDAEGWSAVTPAAGVAGCR